MIRPISKARKPAKDSYNKVSKEWKNGRMCACIGLRESQNGELICSRKSHYCNDIHHARGERGALLTDQRFWVPVCRIAHNWIHNNVDKARILGFLPPRGEWNTMPK